MNSIKYNNLHPFQILNGIGSYFVQQGFVVDVVSGELHEVEGLAVDLRLGSPSVVFNDGDIIFIKITHSDTSSVNFGDYGIIESVSVSTSSENSNTVTSVEVGRIEDGIIQQKLSSDFYFFRGASRD